MWCKLMVQTMSTKESYCDNLSIVIALVMKDANRRGGVTPGSRDGQRGNLGKAGKFTKASAADNSNTDGVY